MSSFEDSANRRQQLLDEHGSDKGDGVNYTPAQTNHKASDVDSNLFLSPNTGREKNKFADIMLSPVRFGQQKLRAGGTSGSIFSLIAATLGSGTLSFAYVVMKVGYILGPILIICGACISYYTGMLIVKASVKTGKTRYEDIALELFGQRISRLTSILNLICLIGFTMTYITYVKRAVPSIVTRYSTDEDLLKTFGENETGNIISAAIFSFGIMFPMSIPRNASALRFSSLFGVLCSMFLSLAVMCVFFTDKKLVESPSENFAKIDAFKFTYNGLVSSVPLIIFAYMYQVNIPMIYIELERRNSKQMSKVIAFGSTVAVVFYIIVGVFGYATFAQEEWQLCTQKNILMAKNYHDSIPIQIGNFSLLFAVICAAPLCVLPSKDTIEELLYKENGMSFKQNLMWTFILTVINFGIAAVIPNIGAAMTLVGCTINPVIGFIMPVFFYWPQIKDTPWYGPEKMKAIVNVIIISVVSVLAFINFFQGLAASSPGQPDPATC